MATTVSAKGQVTLPKVIREALGMLPGGQVEVRAIAPGRIYVEKSTVASARRDQLLKATPAPKQLESVG